MLRLQNVFNIRPRTVLRNACRVKLISEHRREVFLRLMREYEIQNINGNTGVLTTTEKLHVGAFVTGIKASLLATALLFAGALQAADPTVITFGVVPQQTASKLARNWRPILRHLSEKTGLKIRFRTAPSIPVFEERLAAGTYDIAYMNPYHYTEFSKNPGYRAFAKAKNKSIRGIIVVRKDSEINHLSDFDQQIMAFPAPAAFAASVLPRAQFALNNIHVTPKYVSSHDSVYLSIARGIYVGGGGVERTLATVSPEIRDQLKVLWTSEPFTSHPLAAHPRLGKEKVDRIAEAMLAMENSETGLLLLKRLAWKGIEGANDERWDDVRGLGLELLSELVSK